MKALLFIRSLLFYLGYVISLVIWAVISLVVGPFLPLKKRFPFFTIWNRFALFWLRICCGIKCRIHGKEKMIPAPFVLLSNHQSPWETIFLYILFCPVTATLKKELLRIPFFGWGLALLKPIAIDRSRKRSAIQMLLEQGKARLEDGISILVFPEGTRVLPGMQKKFSSGGPSLAIEAGVPVLPVSHNAGYFWPPKTFIKYPGTIDVVIGDPISSENISAKDLTAQVENSIRAGIRPTGQ